MRRPLWVLVGPTAVGKTRLALRIAREAGAEIISADSRQVYRGMDIGTAKPDPVQRGSVPHHLIDVVDPDGPFDAGIFRKLALEAIEAIHRRGKIPLVAGGTGLYVRVLTEGLCEAPKADPGLRLSLLRRETEEGEGTLYAELVRVDPDSARRIHPRDQIRIVRALEVFILAGTPLSRLQREGTGERLPFSVGVVGLTLDREVLYRRIEERVDAMVAQGLEGEVRGLLERGYDKDLPSMMGLGYKQWVGFLRGQYDREEAIRLLKRDTRRYAKRQGTWFRRDPGIHWVSADPDGESTADRVMRTFLSLTTEGSQR
ncbi:MAG: tRNA (adenosine(37)-N6)-dimethylallyltransferase MiaA [Nitrospirae bacterium]|nr:tRNA (adenosine(37)-N6)-dimethylallyltransferase MiaA [Nitrospirota bacterium]